MKKLRTFHRWVAIIYAPFLFVTAFTGLILVFRKVPFVQDLLYNNYLGEKSVKSLLTDLHNYEMITDYIGAILAIGSLTLVISGVILFVRLWLTKRKNKKRQSYSG